MVTTAAPAHEAGWGAARRLLRGALRTLVTGQMLGQGGDGLAQITFAQVVFFEVGEGATPAAVAGFLAATLLPFSLVGPFAGVVVDRFDRRRVMVVVSWVRVAIALASIAVLTFGLEAAAYVGVVLLLSCSRFVLVAKGAALPHTVAPHELIAANAVSSLAPMAVAFLAAVAGSAFVAVAPAAGFVVAAAMYGTAATVFGRLPPVGGGEERGPLASGLRRAASEIADGVAEIARTPALRRPLLAVGAHRLLLGAGFIVIVLLADERYGLEAPGYGLAIAVTGVGAFTGTLLAPVLGERHRAEAILPLTFLLAGLATLLGGYAPVLGVLVPCVGAVALAFQVLKILVDALVGRAARDEVRGRVFAAYDILYNVAFVAAGLLLIPLWDTGRERELLWWLAALFAGAGLLTARSARSWPFGAPADRRAVDGPPPPRGRWWWRAAALVAGGVPVFAFPELSWWWFAWVALVPWLLLVRAAPDRRDAAWRGLAGGTGFVITMHHWLAPNLGPFMLPLGALLGVLWLPWGMLTWHLLRPREGDPRVGAALLLVPSGWVVIEALRSWQSLGGPWALMGASQWNQAATLAPAAVGGVWLVGFLVVLVNVAVTIVSSRGITRPARLVAVGIAVVAIAAGPLYHLLRADPPDRREVRVVAVQPGVVHDPVRRFDEGERLTAELAGDDLDLVVWGESSVGFDLYGRPDLTGRLEALAAAVGADILVNVDARRGGGGILKSSVLVTPTGLDDRYDKMRLVPFGEYVPLRFALGWASRITEAAGEDRHRGEQLVIMESAGITFGPLVCFESAFSDQTRHLTNRGAELLVVQSATSTFQGSWAPAQHASLAAVRAVETGRPVLHATLTGQTAAFDARGERLAELGTDARGTVIVELTPTGGRTIFARFGEWVPAAAFAALALAGLRTGLRAARTPVESDETPAALLQAGKP